MQENLVCSSGSKSNIEQCELKTLLKHYFNLNIEYFRWCKIQKEGNLTNKNLNVWVKHIA